MDSRWSSVQDEFHHDISVPGRLIDNSAIRSLWDAHVEQNDSEKEMKEGSQSGNSDSASTASMNQQMCDASVKYVVVVRTGDCLKISDPKNLEEMNNPFASTSRLPQEEDPKESENQEPPQQPAVSVIEQNRDKKLGPLFEFAPKEPETQTFAWPSQSAQVNVGYSLKITSEGEELQELPSTSDLPDTIPLEWFSFDDDDDDVEMKSTDAKKNTPSTSKKTCWFDLKIGNEEGASSTSPGNSFEIGVKTFLSSLHKHEFAWKIESTEYASPPLLDGTEYNGINNYLRSRNSRRPFNPVIGYERRRRQSNVKSHTKSSGYVCGGCPSTCCINTTLPVRPAAPTPRRKPYDCRKRRKQSGIINRLKFHLNISRTAESRLDQGTDQDTEEDTDQSTDQSTDQNIDQNTDQDTDQNTDQNTDRNTDQNSDQNTDQNTDQNIGRSRLYSLKKVFRALGETIKRIHGKGMIDDAPVAPVASSLSSSTEGNSGIDKSQSIESKPGTSSAWDIAVEQRVELKETEMTIKSNVLLKKMLELNIGNSDNNSPEKSVDKENFNPFAKIDNPIVISDVKQSDLMFGIEKTVDQIARLHLDKPGPSRRNSKSPKKSCSSWINKLHYK